MSRFNSSSSYAHRVTRMESDCYRLWWTFDRHVNGSRLRWPTTYSRDTDFAGAKRFAKKWGLEMPAEMAE